MKNEREKIISIKIMISQELMDHILYKKFEINEF